MDVRDYSGVRNPIIGALTALMHENIEEWLRRKISLRDIAATLLGIGAALGAACDFPENEVKDLVAHCYEEERKERDAAKRTVSTKNRA